MKTYRIPLMIFAAFLVLTTSAVTASAVHYATGGSSVVLGFAAARKATPRLQIEDAPRIPCPEIRLRTTAGADA